MRSYGRLVYQVTKLCELHLAELLITVTSSWWRWRLKSPASSLFTEPFIQAQIKENIKAPRHRPLQGEFNSDRWIPTQIPSNAENVSIWWRHHDCAVCLQAVTEKVTRITWIYQLLCRYHIFNHCPTAAVTPNGARTSADIILTHDDVIKWKHFPRYWPFVWGIHRSPVNSHHDKASDAEPRLKKGLSKQSRRLWFEMSSRSLWRHCNVKIWHTFVRVTGYHGLWSSFGPQLTPYILCMSI